MEVHGRATNSATPPSEEEMELRRGPWTVEEDLVLVNYISSHGEGRWNSLARMAGLRRTGKSCRLRWLNYLRPGVRRGNFTPEEQLLILELHSRWGNRWSKIAQQLPGRTDNEIKNYWRTRVQKHAKQLHCDANSKQFQDVIRYSWMPRLLERIKLPASSSSSASAAAAPSQTPAMDRVETDVELPDGLNPGAHSEPMMLVGCAQGSENRGDDDDGVQRWFDSSLSPNNQRGYPGSVEFDHGWWGAENFGSVDDSWFLQH